ncbi:hypothetical protein ACKUCE_11840 [Flavobacterium psychrophilum]|uniref:hypothetical protein n=1 Tax=Flavobacterium psychrophilum TaxID=96345 RepID=UPI0004E7CAED|nr:hypothetical protein [Flavobacterium psychrophilum]AIJ37098.1 hypothetical protein FPSM_00603 [Flavobacterium psychrophilum]AIN72763.1 hypothetical protein FPG101_02875 [Flavobacterium psychrophilum FPG101]EKT3975138.1 hypothetical protein [Flavobacterium psychrophilum]EKT4527414.1 hypothetical protein [Flavobacterium psychrophilum]EKT4535368.1 hypothetical protein [Flavobacterium psychrophilum]
MTKEQFEEKLIVGVKIRFGKEYAKEHYAREGEIITLVDGEFENDNGLYTNMEHAPSVWNEYAEEFDSIYHLFGNDFENFLDCTIVG